MGKKNTIVYLEHILECITKIEYYTEGFNITKFLESQLIQDAVIRNFEIIGEATKQVPNVVKDRYRTIEWKKMAGMRDKLIHALYWCRFMGGMGCCRGYPA